jgi:diacylglycerol kinase family enzyme
MVGIKVLINRHGGTASSDSDIGVHVTEAFRSVGIETDVALISGGDCAAQCKAIAARGDELVVVGGGDGTISAAASALAGSDTLLGILQLGTLNHFARDLGVPDKLEDAAKLIAERRERRVDVA